MLPTLIANLEQHFNRDVSLLHIPTQTKLPDSTEKFMISLGIGDNYFMTVSSTSSPQMVRRTTDRLRSFRSWLPTSLHFPAELPVLEGTVDGRSYAVWPVHHPLSSIRLLGKCQKMLIAPRIYRWLRGVAAASKHLIPAEQIISDLKSLRALSGLSEPLYHAIDECIHSVECGTILPVSVAQHSDLWIGNVLRKRGAFALCDWGAAKADGAPCFDLLKFSSSVGASTSVIHDEIDGHCAALDVSHPKAVAAFVLAGLGSIATQREHLPRNRFVDLCTSKWAILNRYF